MKKYSAVFYAVVIWLFSSISSADLFIEITGGVPNAVPVAIVPFSIDANVPEDVASIIAADLARSGQFNPLNPNDMLSRPHTAVEVFYRDWNILDVEYLVVGKVRSSTKPGIYEVEFELIDVDKRAVMTHLVYNVTVNQFRHVAHSISDEVYSRLTGIRGAFSTRILYVTVNRKVPEKSRFQLQYADSDGHNAITVFRSSEPIMSPSWSPDGQKIAYVSFEGGRPAIYSQHLATGRRERITSFRGINGAPDWSPDGSKLAFVLSRDGNPEIYVLSMKTRKLTRITKHYAIDTEPRWTPDGKSLIFTSSRGGSPQIYRVDLATRKAKRLTFVGGYNARGAITPDGRHLIMVHRQEGKFHIAVQDLERETFSVVTKTDLDESPSVAPNGSMLIYATLYKGEGVLAAVSIDGRVKFRLPSKEGEVREPVWSPYF